MESLPIWRMKPSQRLACRENAGGRSNWKESAKKPHGRLSCRKNASGRSNWKESAKKPHGRLSCRKNASGRRTEKESTKKPHNRLSRRKNAIEPHYKKLIFAKSDASDWKGRGAVLLTHPILRFFHAVPSRSLCLRLGFCFY